MISHFVLAVKHNIFFLKTIQKFFSSNGLTKIFRKGRTKRQKVDLQLRLARNGQEVCCEGKRNVLKFAQFYKFKKTLTYMFYGM